MLSEMQLNTLPYNIIGLQQLVDVINVIGMKIEASMRYAVIVNFWTSELGLCCRLSFTSSKKGEKEQFYLGHINIAYHLQTLNRYVSILCWKNDCHTFMLFVSLFWFECFKKMLSVYNSKT